MTITRKRGWISGTIEVCCHRVAFRYEIGSRRLTEEMEESLTEAAEERAKELIVEGYHSGELNHVWKGREEIRGWWEIKMD